MEVILLQKVENLGNLGDKVAVKTGYGRNYLIPSGRAVSATKSNLVAFEESRAEHEAVATAALIAAQDRKTTIEDVTVTITRRASEEGKLFGSVGGSDIANALTEGGVDVAKREVRLPNGPFHAIGEFDVIIHLHSDINASLKLEIIAE